jgi:hypothetical protein
MQIMKSLNGLNHVIGCLLTLALSATAHAGDLDLGMQLLEAGQTEQAIEIWRPLAKSGNADAQFGLAVIYNDGIGVPQDYIEANYWFLRAAEQGYSPAQYNLGNAYKNGTGMTPDASLAVIWWRKSAEQGFGPAQYNLGTAYIEGVGIPRDKVTGAQWYRRAAANGHPLAQAYLDKHAAPTDATPEQPAAAVTSQKKTIHKAIEPPQQPAAVAALPTPTPSATAQPVASNGMKQCSEWLQQGLETGYSIQLMANRELESSTNFVRQNDLVDAVICSYSVKNRRWHAVFYGQYATTRETRAAIAELPAAASAGGAFPRRLLEIRQAVEATP